MLTVRGLYYSHSEKQILNDISFQLHYGNICSILGASGSGKSSLLTILSGSIKNYSGEIRLADEIAHIKILKKKMNSIQSSASLNDSDSVRNAVVSARLPYKKTFCPLSPLDWQIADEYISLMGLHSLADAQCDGLPDSAYKKVIIAHALACEASILLLDNPTEGLDPSDISYLEKSLKKYAAKDYTVLIATHDLNFASRISDMLIMMKNGTIVKTGDSGIITEESIKDIFNIDTIVSKNVYNGKPEIMFVPQ